MILVCGEALVDVFVDKPEGAAFPARIVPGGSPFNVAIGLARLGVRAGYLSGLSTDHFGAHLAGILEREGVDLAHCRRLEAPTTLSIVATDANGSPRYAFYGEGAADRRFEIADLPPDLPNDIAAITFGSYSIAVEPSGSAYLAVAKRERHRRVISLDPNVRPTIVGDIAAWRHRFEEFLACAAIVKASDEDIALGWGKTVDSAAVARSWLDRGPKLVVVTRGPDGAAAYFAGGEYRARGRKVDVVDTVGAGDTFHAALIARLEQQDNLSLQLIARLSPDSVRDAIDYAVAASAITCSRRGADLPRRAEVEALLQSGGLT